jgi:hypothetical protein
MWRDGSLEMLPDAERYRKRFKFIYQLAASD